MKSLRIRDLLRPHLRSVIFGLFAVIAGGIANLLEPWPLKVVFDGAFRPRPMTGWVNQWIVMTFGGDKLSIARVAAFAVLAIAAVGACSSYIQKSVTSSVGQWVVHNLRRTLYSHIQQLSLSYHDQKRTGDLTSRITSDIEAIQTFIASGLLNSLLNVLTLAGMIGVMFQVIREPATSRSTRWPNSWPRITTASLSTLSSCWETTYTAVKAPKISKGSSKTSMRPYWKWA